MARPFIVLADPDAEYLGKLELLFLRELGMMADIEAVTDEQYLDSFLAEPHDVDVLVVMQGWNDGRFGAQNVVCTLVLTEDDQLQHVDDAALLTEYKYDNPKFILNQVVGACPVLGSGSAANRECQTILFYSPIGGSGCTVVALGCAAALRSHYYRVLFVDAEFIQSFGYYLDSPREAPPHMANDMMRGARDCFSKMERYICTDAFDYLPPLKGGLASYGVDFDFFIEFVRDVKESALYDFVIVDCDSVFDAGKMELIGEADKVMVVGEPGSSALHKMNEFLSAIDVSAADKFTFVCNKHVSVPAGASQIGASVSFDWGAYVSAVEAPIASSASAMGGLADVLRLATSLE